MISLRALIVAFLGVTLLSWSPAMAQTYFCYRPSAPYVPFGSYAERWDMEMAEAEVDSFIDQMNEYIRCLSRESQDAEYEAQRVIDEWNSAVHSYNMSH